MNLFAITFIILNLLLAGINGAFTIKLFQQNKILAAGISFGAFLIGVSAALFLFQTL